MGEDVDPSIIGRRATDGSYISFREAVKMFATKEDLASLKTGVQMLVTEMASFPTRSEHEIRWERDDEYRKATQEKLDDLVAQRLPQWLFMALGPLAAIGIAFWGAHH